MLIKLRRGHPSPMHSKRNSSEGGKSESSLRLSIPINLLRLVWSHANYGDFPIVVNAFCAHQWHENITWRSLVAGLDHIGMQNYYAIVRYF
jgi:hypothetical protein